MSRRPWSITTRLTLLYTLSASGMLILATLFLHYALVSSLDDEDHEFLGDTIRVLRTILRAHPENFAVLEHEVKWEGVGQQLRQRHFSRILDASRKTIIETPGMGAIMTPSVFPAPIGSKATVGEGVKWKSRDGTVYLLMAAWAQLGNPARKPLLIQLALDVTSELNIIDAYRRNLLAVLILGICFSAGIGSVVAKQGMRPLKEITAAVQRVRVSRLHERIGKTAWPRELTALAAAFDEMLEHIEDSFTRLSRFSADLAHELRTPINNLIGEAEIALSRSRTQEEYRQVLESSLEEHGKLFRTMESLLFLARADSTQAGIERSHLDARKEMDAIREFYDAMAEEQRVKVTCQGNAFLAADPVLFRRAVSNLLSNALRYTPAGGSVIVRAKQLDDQSAEVSVCDTGSGIASDDLPRIFDRFYRTDPARFQYREGAGLGLPIVKSILDLHGGKVTIQSELCKGTTAILWFPRYIKNA